MRPSGPVEPEPKPRKQATAKRVTPTSPPSPAPSKPDRISNEMLRDILPDLYGYSRFIINRHPYLSKDNFKDYVHDAVKDAASSLAGLNLKRIWDPLSIDLATYCRGHVRSRIWKDANLHATQLGCPLDDIEFFQGVPIDEKIALSGLKVDLMRVFGPKPEIMSLLLIVFRDCHFSSTAIAAELSIPVERVKRRWTKITAVARAMAEEVA